MRSGNDEGNGGGAAFKPLWSFVVCFTLRCIATLSEVRARVGIVNA